MSQQNPLTQPRGTYNSTEVLSKGRMERYQSQAQKYGKAKMFFLGVAGVSFAMAYVNRYVWASQVEERVAFKKSRLSQPVTDVSTSEGTQIPWSSRNVDEWLYKPVRITGRPLHNRACLIPSKSYGLTGYEYVVPLCTKETEKGDPLEGVFLNKGFIPHEREHVANRYRIENAFHQQTFVAYVSKMENHQEHSLVEPGNSPDLARNKWNYADLKDMAKVSGFENKALVSAAVLEAVDINTPLDETNARHIDVNADYREDYPYQKTMSGALQEKNMPWHYKSSAQNYFNMGVLSGVAALLLSF